MLDFKQALNRTTALAPGYLVYSKIDQEYRLTVYNTPCKTMLCKVKTVKLLIAK